jgi:hypothetical protein
MATAEMLELMTAEEFAKRPDPGHPQELVLPGILDEFRVRVGRFFE